MPKRLKANGDDVKGDAVADEVAESDEEPEELTLNEVSMAVSGCSTLRPPQLSKFSHDLEPNSSCKKHRCHSHVCRVRESG